MTFEKIVVLLIMDITVIPWLSVRLAGTIERWLDRRKGRNDDIRQSIH